MSFTLSKEEQAQLAGLVNRELGLSLAARAIVYRTRTFEIIEQYGIPAFIDALDEKAQVEMATPHSKLRKHLLPKLEKKLIKLAFEADWENDFVFSGLRPTFAALKKLGAGGNLEMIDALTAMIKEAKPKRNITRELLRDHLAPALELVPESFKGKVFQPRMLQAIGIALIGGKTAQEAVSNLETLKTDPSIWQKLRRWTGVGMPSASFPSITKGR